jgi:4-amino-4-deoxy-L-arabinose transferase-like glycosyltransferase
VLDGLLCALTLLGAALSWKISVSDKAPTRRNSLALGAIWSLAVLTKSVAGLVPAACSLLAVIVVRRDRVTSSSCRNLAWIILLPTLVFGVYAALLWFLAGSKALTIFLGVEILDRALSGFEGHNTGSSGFYLWYLFVRAGAVPQALLCGGLLGACIGWLRDKRLQFLLVWSVVPVLLYSCAASRVPWYLSPYLPLIAILSTAGVRSLFMLVCARMGRRSSLLLLAVIAMLSIPPFYRAVGRNMREVIQDTQRLEIDVLVERLRDTYSDFAIIDNAISGHSNPRKGRFNVEGIYRETLRPNLRAVQQIRELDRRANEVLFIREDRVSDLTPGWHELGRLAPHGARTWSVMVIIYPTEDVEGGG